MDNGVKFLNIEYVFNRIFDVYLWIKYFYIFKIKGETASEYLASKKGIEYDGLRDRFGLSDPYSSLNSLNLKGTSLSTGKLSSQTSDGTGLSYIWNKIMSIFGGGNTASVGSAVQSTGELSGGLYHLLSMMRDLMTLLAIVIISVYIYSAIRWKEVCTEFFDKYKKTHNPKSPQTGVAIKNSKWATIESYMSSNDEAQWRLAILEADSMLADLLKTLPIPGIDVGEKLTNANKNTFQTLDDAWEAHKVRNRIAHEGSNFFVTEHLARKTINQYKNVFTEFQFGV